MSKYLDHADIDNAVADATATGELTFQADISGLSGNRYVGFGGIFVALLKSVPLY